ncbi:MAG: Ig-like domain-containing protein [Anaeromyxobacteraceae bacterium]
MTRSFTKVSPLAAALAISSCSADPTRVFVERTAEASSPGLLAGYGFAEGAGATTADASGNGLTGTFVGGATWTTGRTGSGVSLDGSSGYVNLGSPAALSLTGSLTVSAWVYESANVADDGIIVARSSGIGGWELKSSPDTGTRTYALGLYTTTGAYLARHANFTRALDTWYHVAGVYDAAARTLHVYVNGVLADGPLRGVAVPSSIGATSVNVNIGRRAAGFYLRGTIDDVRIYGRALTQAEIQADLASPVSAGGTSGDVTPPTVAITAPAAGASVSGSVAVTANAADAGGVAGVTFLLDGAPLGAEDVTAPYAVTWNTATAAPGTHVLTARARDAAGNTAVSPGVSVTVASGTPAGTVLVNGGAPATATRAVTLGLTSSGPVTQMRFSNDGRSWSTAEPFAATKAWTLTTNDGTKTVRAQFGSAGGTWSATASDSIVLDTTAPTISSVAATNVLGTSATIGWTTSEAATSQVEYGPTTSYGAVTPLDPALVTTHQVALAGLSPSTPYFYRVVSADWAGNTRTSAGSSFTTAAVADQTPPSVPTGLTATAVDAQRIDLAWAASTDDRGVAGYDVERDGATVTSVPTPRFSDTGLQPGSTHVYAVRAFDAAGNASAWSSGATATTPAGPGVATPTLVQHVSSTVNPRGNGETGNHFAFTLPNPVLAGNCLILGIARESGAAFAATPVTDTNGTWPTAPAASITDANHNVDLAIFVLPDARPGAHVITVHFTAPIIPFQYTVSEFRNIATTSPVSGFAGASNDAAPAIGSGTFTPASNDAAGGNLVWSMFFDDANPGSGNEVTAFTAGPGFTLLNANIMWHRVASVHSATQYTVQRTAAPISPSMTAPMSPSNDPFIGLSIALRAAPAGTAPAPGIRVAKVMHLTNEIPPTTMTLQAPTTGNTVVLVTHETPIIDITSVTDSAGNVYRKVQPESDEPQYWIAGNAITGPDLVLTLRISGQAQGTSILVYDVEGADPSPIGASSGAPSRLLDHVTRTDDFPVLTPGQAQGITFAACTLGQGPELSLASGSPAGAVDDYVHYAGQTDTSFMDNADCRAHVTTTSTATQHWNWNITDRPANSGSATAVHLTGPVGAAP